MDARKLIVMSFFLTAFVLGHAASYAQENEDSVFVSGSIGVGNTNGVCPGNCSADPTGTIGIGYAYSRTSSFLGSVRNAVSLEYTRQQFNINGNALDVTVKGITFYPGFSFGEDDRFTCALAIQWGVVTSSGSNISERQQTGWGGRNGVDIFYRVGPGLDVMLGESTLLVTTSTLPDFISYSVDAGLRWNF